MKLTHFIGGTTFGIICVTIDSWPTWAVLTLALVICCGIFLAALIAEVNKQTDPDDRTEHWSDTPIADELDRKYGRN